MVNEKSITKGASDARTDAAVVESLALRGDISGLSPTDRVRYYLKTCADLKLNPSAQPFAFLRLNGKEVMYPTRGATDQLAAIHGINREIIDGPKVLDLAGAKVLFAVCRATFGHRVETATAAVPLPTGAENICNAVMKTETKARRRATLAILGLALVDETELETIPAGQKADLGAPSSEDIARVMAGEDIPAAALGAGAEVDHLAALTSALASVTTLGALREVYHQHAQGLHTQGTADSGLAAVRARLKALMYPLNAAEVQSILSSAQPDTFLAYLDGLAPLERREQIIEHYTAHVAELATCGAWPKATARNATGRALVEVKVPQPEAKAILDRAEGVEPSPPDDGGSAPKKRRSSTTSAADGSAAESTPANDAPQAAAHPEAWRLSSHGITAHVAGIGNIHRLSASARKHLPLIAEVLRTHAVHEYAGRLQALSHDGTSTLAWEACVERAETWLREGPKVADMPRRAIGQRPQQRAAGGAR